jgi:hypothetical protein
MYAINICKIKGLAWVLCSKRGCWTLVVCAYRSTNSGPSLSLLMGHLIFSCGRDGPKMYVYFLSYFLYFEKIE